MFTCVLQVYYCNKTEEHEVDRNTKQIDLLPSSEQRQCKVQNVQTKKMGRKCNNKKTPKPSVEPLSIGIFLFILVDIFLLYTSRPCTIVTNLLTIFGGLPKCPRNVHAPEHWGLGP